MAEFVYRGEKIIGIDEPIILENNTDASFDVGVGIIFRKSGLYRVSVDGKHTSVKIEPERKKGKWIFIHPLQADDEGAYICSNCHRGDWDIKPTDKYCKFCGMAMDIYATLLP